MAGNVNPAQRRILNEVLSITAQEFNGDKTVKTQYVILNEVLSITAQEFLHLVVPTSAELSSMKS